MAASGRQEPPSGTVFVFTEPQYRFGVGPILVRAVQMVAQVEFDGAAWWHIRAEVANGTPERHGSWIPRELYVDAVALPPTRHTWVPPAGTRP
jgi:hypothetical protein